MGATIPVWVPPVTPSGTLNGQRDVAKQTETVAAVDSVIPIAYGEVQVGGRIFVATYTGGYWYVGALFCLGEIESFVALYLDGVDIKASTPAGMTATYYTGTTSQTADATLAGAISGYTDTLVVSTPGGSVGIAYVVLKYTDAHYSGLPKIVARIKGRKVAPISQNLIANSEAVSDWTWTANALVTADLAAAPDGTTTADKLTENNTDGTQKYAASPTVAAASIPDYSVVTFSIFAQAAERSELRLQIVDKSGTISSAAFANLSTGIITSKSGANFVDAVLTPFASGWYRFSLSANVGTGATAVRARVSLVSGGVVAYTGVIGNGLYLWGGQLELKPSAGVYTKTTTAPTAVAYSENPVLCLRDLILSGAFGAGEDVDDLSALAAATECDNLVITEPRRKLAILIDSPRPLADWVATLATYCGAFVAKDKGRYTFVPDRPALLAQFDGSTNGWTGSNATITTGATALTVTATATSPGIVSPASPYSLNVPGAQAAIVRARVRRTSGTGGWNGTCHWLTSWHGFVTAAKLDVAAPVGYVNGDWIIVEWDLRRVTNGGDDWTESIIKQIRLRFWSGATDVVEVGFVSIGIEPITTADIVRGTFSAGTIDRAQIPTVVRVAYTDTSTTEWRSRDATSEETGVSTGTVARRESAVQLPGVTRYSQAIREAVERRKKLAASLYCEFVRFDLGLRTAVGSLLSIKHPYLDNIGTAEADSSTLFRVTAADVIGPGRVRVRAVQYLDSAYDDTEASTTWAEFLRRGGNLGGSGDGINRVHGRFAGAWSAVDYDGQFPVFKGSDVDFCSVTAGTAAPYPLTGYYGAYALKIQTKAGSTNRTVYLGSSATDYNIAIDPRSKWLASCKFWPIVSNTSVDINLKSSAGTVYTLTDSTNTAETWNDFVHTATGANVFNLTNDASDKAVIRLDVTLSSTTVFFDGLMLEKKVGNGAIVSPWRPPVASSTNPSRVSPRLISPGMLDESVQIEIGGGVAGKIVAGVWTSATTDGTAVTFPVAYATPPKVIFQPGALTNWNAYATDFALVCEARSVTTTGFTAFLKIRQVAGTITTTTDTTVVDEGSTAQPRYTIHKTVAAQAWDDRYTFQYDVTIKNIKEFEPGYNGYVSGDMTVGFFVALSSGVWTLVGSASLAGTSGTSSTTTLNNLKATVVVDGLGQHAGKEFGVAILSESNPGGSLTLDNVSYGTATAPTETTATPAGVAPVPFTVMPA